MWTVNWGGCVVAEDTVFAVLYDKFMFWGILVGIFTFGWLFLAMLRYREGVEPDTTHIDHIEVGSFPVDRHHTTLEVFFYVLPTLIVAWLIVLALASNTAVWTIPDNDEDAQYMKVIGKQWFWEYEYTDALTWQDDPDETDIQVSWEGIMLTVNSTENPNAVNVSITRIGGNDFSNTEDIAPLSIDQMTGEAEAFLTFDEGKFAKVEVTDAEDNVLHTWMHIPGEDPNGYRETFAFSSALGEDMIIPCDKSVVFEMHSAPSDDSNPNYIGVQHSFWLPEWGVKEDLVPGLEGGTYMTVVPDDPGTFPIRCAEYCGNQHSMMIGQVKVVAPIVDGVFVNCDEDTGVAKSSDGSTGGDY